MAEFFNMSGYGLYIWGAYGTAFVILLTVAALTLYKSIRLKREQRLLEKD